MGKINPPNWLIKNVTVVYIVDSRVIVTESWLIFLSGRWWFFLPTKPGKEYVKQLTSRYKKAEKNEKRTILDEFIKTTGYHRKSAIRILSGNYSYTTKPIKRPRNRRYDLLDAIVLAKVCTLLDWINAKRIQPQIGVAIDRLVADGQLTNLPVLRKKLVKISPATSDRLLTRYKQRPTGKGRSYTKPGTLLNQIPVRTFADWNENKVGSFEIDLVGHDGGIAKGDFGWTLNFTDIKSCWGEQVAVKNKAQVHVFAGIKCVRIRLPFSLLGHGGSEFINDQLFRYCTKEEIPFTKGRAEKKNDQAHIQQKNDSIVRQWVSYGRYDTAEQIAIRNELYELLRLYLNFFIPVMKLKEKKRIGSKTIKRYDKPATPYKRILRAKDIPKQVKEKLQKQYETLNLVSLKKQIDAVLKRLKPTPVR